MTQDDVIAFVSGLPGVEVLTAGEENGAPEVAWGDTFFYVGADRRMPFATIVTTDYDGFDTASDLNRDGVFRVNVNAGRAAFEEHLGYPPGTDPGRVDYTALDTLIPHPVYAVQSWVSVLNPGVETAERVRALLVAAHARAARRRRA